MVSCATLSRSPPHTHYLRPPSFYMQSGRSSNGLLLLASTVKLLLDCPTSAYSSLAPIYPHTLIFPALVHFCACMNSHSVTRRLLYQVSAAYAVAISLVQLRPHFPVSNGILTATSAN